MVSRYGEQQKMFKTFINDKENYVTKQYYSFKTSTGIGMECSFYDNPMFIIWNNQGLRISITLPPGQESTFISFNGDSD